LDRPAEAGSRPRHGLDIFGQSFFARQLNGIPTYFFSADRKRMLSTSSAIRRTGRLEAVESGEPQSLL
jgi:hypothetical protein